MLNLPKIEFGDATDALAKMRDAIHWMRGIKGDGTALVKTESAGTVISANIPEHMDIVLAGSTSPYTGNIAMPLTGGGWAGVGSSITGIYEYNGVSGLAGKTVPAERVFGDSWRFNYIRYNSGPPSHYLPGCACTVIPDNLKLNTTNTFVFGVVMTNEPINYGPVPASVQARSGYPNVGRPSTICPLPPNGWWTVNTFVDPVNFPYPYYVYLVCEYGTYELWLVAASDSHPGLNDPTKKYDWTGVTCSPFLMYAGTTGIGATNTVTISP